MLGFGPIGTIAVATGPNSPALTLLPMGAFSQPLPKRVLTAAVIATTTVGFVAPPQFQPFVFSQFSQPIAGRTVLPDEQTSLIFEVEPPQPPPFTGFARFEGLLRARYNVALFNQFTVTPFTPVPDTHDGVWVKRKRKRTGPDPIELELAEKAARRAALELAVYGPEVEYSEPPTVFAAPAPMPVNVAELAKVIGAAQAQQMLAARSQAEQDEESDLEAILREIL